MTDLHTAAKMALETFERMGHSESIFAGEFDSEITALRQALEQPAQDDWKDRLIAQNEETILWQAKRIADLTAQQEPVALKKGECWPEDVMQMWDYYRKEIANGNIGSEPRDWFESLAEMRLVDTRPQAREPLTQQEVVDGFCKQPHDVQFVSVFNAGVRFAESAHGIGEKNT